MASPAAQVPAPAPVPQRLAARLTSMPQRLATRFTALPQSRQERLQDAGLAVALAAVNAASLFPYRTSLHPFWVAQLLVIAQAIPLIWRRSHVIGTGFVIGIARVVYDRLGFAYAPFPLGPAIAFYTIIDRRGPAWRWMACGIVVAGITISEASPGHSEPYDAIFQAVIFLTAWVAGTASRAKRANLAAERSRADRAESELDRQTALAAATERTRIARELHDIVAHHVGLVAIQAEAATSLLPDRPTQAQRPVEIIAETARQALAELRRLLGVLRPPSERPQMAPQASLADIDAMLDQVRGAGLAVDFRIDGEPFPLAPGIELAAHRIVQEALTNTLRHSGARQAAVTLTYAPGFVTVAISDSGQASAGNGQGPPAPAAGHSAEGTGLGLAGIAERVVSCGGTLAVGPTSPRGFAVTARLPAQ